MKTDIYISQLNFKLLSVIAPFTFLRSGFPTVTFGTCEELDEITLGNERVLKNVLERYSNLLIRKFPKISHSFSSNYPRNRCLPEFTIFLITFLHSFPPSLRNLTLNLGKSRFNKCGEVGCDLTIARVCKVYTRYFACVRKGCCIMHREE